MGIYEDIFIENCKILLAFFTVKDCQSYDNKLEGLMELREKIFKHSLARTKLRELLFDDDGSIRILAAEALSKTKSFPEEAIPVLQAVLDVCKENNMINERKDLLRITLGSLVNFEENSVLAENSIWPYVYTQNDINLQMYAIKAISKIAKVSDASWTILCLLCHHDNNEISDFTKDLMNSEDFKNYIINK